jgi:hypothetical protein
MGESRFRLSDHHDSSTGPLPSKITRLPDFPITQSSPGALGGVRIPCSVLFSICVISVISGKVFLFCCTHFGNRCIMGL